MLSYKLPVKKFMTIDERRLIHRICHAALPNIVEAPPIRDNTGELIQENLFTETPQQTLTTFYCGFLPLRIYTEFGAENVHHAYNKAAKQWGDKNQFGQTTIAITKHHRLIVNQNEMSFTGTMNGHWTKVSHSEFTAIIKAWRSAQ